MVVCFCVELWFFSGVWFLFGTMSPLRPDPCLFVYLRRPLLFCSVGFVDAMFSLLFLFLSGAGETQAPFGGSGVPLVFLRPGRALRPRSVRHPLHLHQGCAPHLFFPFFFRRRRSFAGSVFSRFLSCRCRFSWWVFFVPGLCRCLCAALHD